MSSSTFKYTEAEQARLFRQFASVMELAQEGQRPAGKISRALEALISDDHIKVMPKVSMTPTGKVYHVTADFRSAQEAIEALKCPLKWGLAREPDKIPLVIQPPDCQLRAVPLGKVVRTQELFTLFPRIANPVALFAFGAKFPDEQKEEPHFTVWLDGTGRFWCAALGVAGGERYVCVYRDVLDGKWRERYRLLVCE